MKRLTVSEVAQRLKMSEDAVRKLTLGAKQTDEDKGTENSDGVRANTQRSWWDYAAGASGLLLLFGGLIYALGLFVLWVPITVLHTRNLITAWYAALLVPRATVAGLGVGQLVAFPLATGFLVFGLFYFAAAFERSPGRRERTWTGEIVAFITWVIALAGTLVLVGFYIIRLLSTIPSGTFAFVSIAIVFFAGGIVYWAGIWANYFLLSTRGRMSRTQRLFRSFAGVFAAAFIAAFLLVLGVPSDPPLPMVEIDVKNKDKDIVGTLLTHTEGFWYVFEDRKEQAGSKLTAIPDDEVKTAWVPKDFAEPRQGEVRHSPTPDGSGPP